jgi:glycosyltransferase involved in cell wall biosynthesis
VAVLERALADCGHLDSVTAKPPFPGASVEAASRSAALWGAIPGRLGSRGLSAELADLEEAADLVVLHPLAAYWWSPARDARPMVIDINDVVSQVLSQGLRYGAWPARPLKWARYFWCKRSERALIGQFRMAFVCSEADRQYFQLPRVEVVSNAYQVHPLMDVPRPPEAERDLLFVGSMFYPPNLEGVQWFVRQVLPLIRKQRPNVTFTVIGRSPTKLPPGWRWLNSEGIEFIGTVPEVAPYVRSARLEVCPLLRGTGTRVKILESLAFGTPVVSTRIGAFGLPMENSEGLIRSDSPQEFADACLKLLGDAGLRDVVGDSGRSSVRAQFSPQAVRAVVSGLIREVLG